MRETLTKRLQNAFINAEISVINESDQHAGHRGSPNTGNSHFAVTVVSDGFQSMAKVKRHRMVYACVADLMPTPIHALRIHAVTNDEV